MKSQPASKLLTPIILGLAIPALSSTYIGCKKDKPPPPLPPPASATAPAKPLVLGPEDAAAAAPEDADAAKKKVTGVYHASSLANCCAALSQNAASAPDKTTKGYLQAAAGVCSALAAQGKSKNAALGAIQGALKGAGLPTACR